MSTGDELRRENAMLRARFAALSEASLRIGASLDLETVLQEVADSARALTKARYASIATIDETGAPGDFVVSGVTEEELRHLLDWPDRHKLFEHVRDLDGPLQMADFAAFLRSLGLADGLMMSFKVFLGTPIRHQGVHVGNFYLEGERTFTSEDE